MIAGVTAQQHPLHLNDCRGFSLIELLAVLLIIGFAVSFVSVNISNNSAYQLRFEAKQFANSTALMAEEAVLSNRQWGVDFFRDFNESGVEQLGYRWLILTDDGLWVEAGNIFPDVYGGDVDSGDSSEFLFSIGTDLHLELEGTEQEQSIETKQNIETEQTISGAAAPSTLLDEPRVQVQPELWLLSSGEMTAFTLQLFLADDPDNQVTVRGDALGRIVLESGIEDE